MLNGKKEAEIIWLNYQEMMEEAEGNKDEAFFELPQHLYDVLSNLLMDQTVKAWNPCGVYDLVDDEDNWKAFRDVVSFKIDAEIVSWQDMMGYLLEMTKMPEFRGMVLKIVFRCDKSSGETCICNGQFTSILFDFETGRVVRAF